jgi:hypothetical protein
VALKQAGLAVFGCAQFFGDMLNMLEQTLATPPDLSPHGLMKTGWQG